MTVALGPAIADPAGLLRRDLRHTRKRGVPAAAAASVTPSPEGALRRDMRGARKRRRLSRDIRSLATFLVIVGAVVVLIQAFVVRGFYVPSASMEPTLNISDRMMVDELTPKLTGYHRGDIVVFSDPGGWLSGEGDSDHVVKRLIGLPGDTIDGLENGTLVVNGKKLYEPYARMAPQEPFTATVPPGHVWVMGDNRGDSADSRFHGAVPMSDLTGRVFLRYWPIPDIGFPS